MIGSIQVKYLAGLGSLLADRLLIYDGETMEIVETRLKEAPACPFFRWHGSEE